MQIPSRQSNVLVIMVLLGSLLGSSIARAEESPDEVFDRVHRRYLELDRFAEDVRVVEILEDPATDAPPIRTRIDVRVEVDGDWCEVVRPTVAPRIVDALVEDSEGPSEADLELLPQLRLRFDPDPLANLRRAVADRFSPVEFERETIEDREILRLHLCAGPEDDPSARVELEIDADAMLIDRVTGRECLPGGLVRRFDVRIRDREIARSPDDAGPETPIEPEPLEPVDPVGTVKDGQRPAIDSSASS